MPRENNAYSLITFSKFLAAGPHYLLIAKVGSQHYRRKRGPEHVEAKYAAQQRLVAIRQADFANQVTLYKTLGSGWAQHTAAPR